MKMLNINSLGRTARQLLTFSLIVILTTLMCVAMPLISPAQVTRSPASVTPEQIGDPIYQLAPLDIVIVDNIAYVANGLTGLFTVDISNPAQPTTLGNIRLDPVTAILDSRTFTRPGTIDNIAIAGNIAYVTSQGFGGPHLIDISNPAEPKKLFFSTANFPEKTTGIAVQGTTAYVTTHSQYETKAKLKIFDVSNPTVAPKLLNSIETPGDNALDVAVVGNVAYLTDSAGLHSIDISNPTVERNDRVLDSLDDSSARKITIVDDTAYLARANAGVKIVDTRNPRELKELGHFDTPGAAAKVAVVGNTAYVADFNAGLQIFDVSNPADVKSLGQHTEYLSRAFEVAVSGNTAYVVEFGRYISVIDVTPDDTPTAMGEFGLMTNLTHEAQTISLKHTFTNPVVFAQPASFLGSPPVAVRISNVTGDSFEVRLEEPSNEDGRHDRERVSYLVLEAGRWQLEDGTSLEVGKQETAQAVSQGFDAINFSSPFPATPVVFSQLQTHRGADFARTRQQAASLQGFQVGVEEEEKLANSGHSQETLGWFAMEPKRGNWSGHPYQVTIVPGLTNQFKRIPLNGFGQTPKLIGALASYNDTDPAGLRYQNLAANRVELKVEEDQSADHEVQHAAEAASVLAIQGEGLLNAAQGR